MPEVWVPGVAEAAGCRRAATPPPGAGWRAHDWRERWVEPTMPAVNQAAPARRRQRQPRQTTHRCVDLRDIEESMLSALPQMSCNIQSYFES